MSQRDEENTEDQDELEDEDQIDDDADDAGDDDQDDESDDSDDEDEDDEPFEGTFDPKRARALIDRQRRELKEARKQAAANKGRGSKPLQQENLRLRVALKTGLDEDLAGRLRGSTEEELLADAEKLLDLLHPTEKPKLTPRTPRTKLRGGSKPNDEVEPSADDVVKAALGR